MALYGLLAPFIAPNFFLESDPLLSVIKAYAVIAIGLFTRPIGVLVFGKLAMTIGSRNVMIICLSGVAITTGLLGLTPSYEYIGAYSTWSFIVIRVMYGIFASGENIVSPFFIMQNSSSRRATRTSSFYSFFDMLGVILASLTATIINYTSNPYFYWRYAFILGFFMSLFGLILRIYIIENLEDAIPKISTKELLNLVFKNRKKILQVMFVGSFSSITYTIPFIFMNSFIPEVTNISIGQMLQLNTALLVIDTALIPIFGIFAQRFDRRKLMSSMSLFVGIIILPLFYFIDGASFSYVIFVRVVIILGGIAFITPKYAFYFNLFKGNERYLLYGIGLSVGVGKNSTAICLSLWYYFRTPIAPAFYVLFLAILAFLALTVMHDSSEED